MTWSPDLSARQVAARRDALEERFTAHVERGSERFLSTMYGLASAAYLPAKTDGLGVTVLPIRWADVEEAWRETVSDIMWAVERDDALDLDGSALSVLAEMLLLASLPTDAYTSATTVLTAAAEEMMTLASARSALREALSLDESETVPMPSPPEGDAVVAAGGRAKHRRSSKKRVLRNPLPGTGSRGANRQAAARRVARTLATLIAARKMTDEMRQAGYTTRAWQSMYDERVRPTHTAADGQEQGLDEPFRVGSALLMYPGDPDGPASETMNCRCVVVAVEALVEELDDIDLPSVDDLLSGWENDGWEGLYRPEGVHVQRWVSALSRH